MKTCMGCKSALWDRTAAGALHPSGNGQCTFKVKLPLLPVAFVWMGGTPHLGGGSITRREDNKTDCPFWSRK